MKFRACGAQPGLYDGDIRPCAGGHGRRNRLPRDLWGLGYRDVPAIITEQRTE